MRHVPILAALLCSLLSPGPALADPEARTFDFGGESRLYLFHRPEQARPGPLPLVLVLHGAGGTAEAVRKSSAAEFDALSDAHGFLLAYPEAMGGTWDLGRGTMSRQLKQHHDDPGFLRALIRSLVETEGADPARIFVTGVSRGGQAAFLLACDGSGLVRAIAPVSMTLPDNQVKDCQAAPPFGVMIVAGAEDPVVPYGGGAITLRGRSFDKVLGAEASFDLLSAHNRCTGSSDLPAPDGYQMRGGTGCAAPVQLFSFLHGDHGWPDEISAGGQGVIGPDKVWEFFSQY